MSSFSGGASMAIGSRRRVDAEVAPETRVGRGRLHAGARPAETALQPVAQQVEPGVVSAEFGQVGPRKVGCGVAWQL